MKISNAEIDDGIQKPFQQEMNMAIFRYMNISYEIESIIGALEGAKIRFIPLKGAVIRDFYKEPWLRTSCDIDILISPDDVERAKEAFITELNYEYVSSWNYEHSFHTPSKIHIELHHTLGDEGDIIDNVLSTVWERSTPVSGYSYYHKMSDEMYYFYHMAHMAKHFINGGCGIRPFIDIWVLNNRCEFDKSNRQTLLEEGGLLQFATVSEELSDVWFGNAKHTHITQELENFILSGGVYGTVENRVVVQQVVTGGKLSYIMSRIFLPYDQLEITFPNLAKRKWLFPFYQVKRWFRLLKKGRIKRSVGEVKASSNVSSDENAKATELLRALNLK